jgi:hypothetical protein
MSFVTLSQEVRRWQRAWHWLWQDGSFFRHSSLSLLQLTLKTHAQLRGALRWRRRPVPLADRNYAGRCLKITEDTPRLGELGFNDVTSSIRFVGSLAGGHRFAELYVDGNYGGDLQIVSSDVPWMGETVGRYLYRSSIAILSSSGMVTPVTLPCDRTTPF